MQNDQDASIHQILGGGVAFGILILWVAYLCLP